MSDQIISQPQFWSTPNETAAILASIDANKFKIRQVVVDPSEYVDDTKKESVSKLVKPKAKPRGRSSKQNFDKYENQYKDWLLAQPAEWYGLLETSRAILFKECAKTLRWRLIDDGRFEFKKMLFESRNLWFVRVKQNAE